VVSAVTADVPNRDIPIVVRPLESADRDDWMPLWLSYQTFYRVSLSNEVTDHLWSQISKPGGKVRGLGADVDGNLVGIVHFLFHPSTWSMTGYCYLEDLFTAPDSRIKGIGRALISAVVEEARAVGTDKVYWQTHETNAVAQVLYNRVANRSGFVVYEVPIA
jgi:GNAT superfamily N-acetyltransferase